MQCLGKCETQQGLLFHKQTAPSFGSEADASLISMRLSIRLTLKKFAGNASTLFYRSVPENCKCTARSKHTL